MTLVAHRLAAEAGGTAMLVVAVVGSGIMAANLTSDTAVALLCNAIVTAAALVVLITLLGPISGAHLNPAVTAVLAARGQLPWNVAALYIAAQLLGAVIGILAAHAMFELPLLQVGTTTRTGLGQWLAEIVATSDLITVILLGTRDRHPQAALPLLVGLYILAAYWFTASTSFANPALTIARSLTATFAGIAPLDTPMFITAQLAGAALCVLGARVLARRNS